MRAQNRHDTARWKARRKTHLADKCRNAKCTICHPDKVMRKTKPKYKPLKPNLTP